MKTLIFLASAAAVTGPSYQLDLSRYFPSPAMEQTQRTQLLAELDAFQKQAASELDSPQALDRWLDEYDSLSKGLNRHDTYVYLRAEEDTEDHADAKADEDFGIAETRLDAHVQETLAKIGADKLQGDLAADAALAPYRYFIDSSLAKAAHARPAVQADTLLTTPALDTLSASYSQLRRKALAAMPAVKSTTGKDAFDARWKPYLGDEDGFASLLLPIVSLHNGEGKLEGFSGGVEAKYSSLSLSTAEVDAMLKAVQASGAQKRYLAVVAAQAARRLQVAPAELHAWDLDAADSYQPKPVPFPEVVPMILAAEEPMGPDYAGRFKRLFDPAQRRVEWCNSKACDDTGFSVEVPGVPSGLYYGAYNGDVHTMRATAHEAGHAVHGELRDEDQPLAVYLDGPNYMGESVAIFNEYLFLQHLYQTAPTPEARAYYLHFFLDQVSFEVWGSAAETDLERSIYEGVQGGSLHGAADLDALTMKVLARYTPAPSLDPQMKVYWARDRLFYTDPLYDVNYLYAGLLALEYLHQLERDPKGFPTRYMALLKNGFTDTPQNLEKKFLGIDMDDAAGLVKDASDLMTTRTQELQALYAGCASGSGCKP